MAQDTKWKIFLSNNARYADVINGIAGGGRQLITKENLYDTDTNTGGSDKIRDIIRKTSFGLNFSIIGIENQETIDYSMPLRSMSYDAGEYEKQASIKRTC